MFILCLIVFNKCLLIFSLKYVSLRATSLEKLLLFEIMVLRLFSYLFIYISWRCSIQFFLLNKNNLLPQLVKMKIVNSLAAI